MWGTHFSRKNSTNHSAQEAKRRQRGRFRPSLEALEARQCLAGDLAELLAEPVDQQQILTHRGVPAATSQVPTALADKVTGDLWRAIEVARPLYGPRELSSNRAAAAGEPTLRATMADFRSDDLGRVNVDVWFDAETERAEKLLSAAGFKIGSITVNSDNRALVSGWLEQSALERVAALPFVQRIELPVLAVTNGAFTTAGDGIHRASNVRSSFNFGANVVTGAQSKIGVISDGIDHAYVSQATSDLPATINTTSALLGSGDEGTAIMEIVYDIAPGATYYFAGAANPTEMVSAITWLRSQGVNIIVDDLSFPSQKYFEDDTVANEVASAVAAGVTYITSAGNAAQSHYESAFVGAGGYHDFDTSGIVNNWLPVVVGAGTPSVPAETLFTLQWSDAWGTSANDFRIEVYDGFGSLIASSSDPAFVQNGNDNPFDMVGLQNIGAQATVYFKIAYSGVASRRFELFSWGPAAIPTAGFGTSASSIFGHAAVPGAIVVGAVSALDPGNDDIQAYSSQGPAVLVNPATQATTTRNPLDGVAVDDVYTKIGDAGYFPSQPFGGTSASAPHVAGLVALLRDIKPTATPAQLSTALSNTAVGLGTAGYDDVYGNGRFDVLNAAYSLYTPTAPALASGSDTGRSNTDRITNDNTPTFTGSVPANSYVTLFVNGVANVSQQLSGGNTSYSLTPAALIDGAHSILVKVASSSSSTFVSSGSAAISVTVDTVAPTLTPTTFSLHSSADSGASNSDNLTNLTSLTFNITLLPAGLTANVFDGATAIKLWSGAVSTVVNATISTEGVHTFTARWADDAGNFGPASPAAVVTVDLTAPAAPSTPDLWSSSDNGMSSTDNITNVNTPTFQMYSTDTHYRLYRNSSLITGLYSSITSTPQHTSPTLADGTYWYELRSVDAAGNLSAASPSVMVKIDTVAPTGAFAAVSPNPRTTAVSSIDLVFSEAMWQIGAWYLQRNGSSAVTGMETFTQINTTTYRLGNLSGSTTANGVYDVGLMGPVAILDVAGNINFGVGTTSWVKT